MKHGSLFSGIGGFDLAAEWMGWENIFHCDTDKFGNKLLNYYWPKSINYNDITKTNFTIHRGTIDVLTGGFPCQPYSVAGKRLGKNDERHLWPHMLKAIRQIRPRWVVGENVRGLVNWNGGLVFHEVWDDLEREGYEVQPFIIPAASVNAPHKRERIWYVAHAIENTIGDGQLFGEPNQEGTEIREQRDVSTRGSDRIHLSEGIPSDTIDTRAGNDLRTNGHEQKKDKGRKRLPLTKLGENGCDGDVTKTTSIGGEETNGDRKSRLIDQTGKNNDWSTFPTKSPLCSGDDGLPVELDGLTFSEWRKLSLKSYGNAVVPQVVLRIFQTIELYENKIKKI
jgi:DNA (cytosine-5)-methyltransferase 1